MKKGLVKHCVEHMEHHACLCLLGRPSNFCSILSPHLNFDWGGWSCVYIVPMCFPVTQFLSVLQDVNSAVSVHANLQGAVLSTSDRGGIRIQYPYITRVYHTWHAWPRLQPILSFCLCSEIWSRFDWSNRCHSGDNVACCCCCMTLLLSLASIINFIELSWFWCQNLRHECIQSSKN